MVTSRGGHNAYESAAQSIHRLGPVVQRFSNDLATLLATSAAEEDVLPPIHGAVLPPTSRSSARGRPDMQSLHSCCDTFEI